MVEFFAKIAKKNEGLSINVPLTAIQSFSRGDLVLVRKITLDTIKVDENSIKVHLCRKCGDVDEDTG